MADPGNKGLGSDSGDSLDFEAVRSRIDPTATEADVIKAATIAGMSITDKAGKRYFKESEIPTIKKAYQKLKVEASKTRPGDPAAPAPTEEAAGVIDTSKHGDPSEEMPTGEIKFDEGDDLRLTSAEAGMQTAEISSQDTFVDDPTKKFNPADYYTYDEAKKRSGIGDDFGRLGKDDLHYVDRPEGRYFLKADVDKFDFKKFQLELTPRWPAPATHSTGAAAPPPLPPPVRRRTTAPVNLLPRTAEAAEGEETEIETEPTDPEAGGGDREEPPVRWRVIRRRRGKGDVIIKFMGPIGSNNGNRRVLTAQPPASPVAATTIAAPPAPPENARRRKLPWWAWLIIVGIAVPTVAWIVHRELDRASDNKTAKVEQIERSSSTDTAGSSEIRKGIGEVKSAVVGGFKTTESRLANIEDGVNRLGQEKAKNADPEPKQVAPAPKPPVVQDPLSKFRKDVEFGYLARQDGDMEGYAQYQLDIGRYLQANKAMGREALAKEMLPRCNGDELFVEDLFKKFNVTTK